MNVTNLYLHLIFPVTLFLKTDVLIFFYIRPWGLIEINTKNIYYHLVGKYAKDMNKQFMTLYKKITSNKPIKGCLTSLIFKEMQIKIILIRLANIYKFDNNQA